MDMLIMKRTEKAYIYYFSKSGMLSNLKKQYSEVFILFWYNEHMKCSFVCFLNLQLYNSRSASL